MPAPKIRVGRRGTTVRVSEGDEGILVSGMGTAIADTVIEQDSAYWEVQVLDPGTGCQVGVSYALTGHLLDAQLGDKENSWSISGADGIPFARDDVIGVAYGQGDIPNLRYFHNNKLMEDATVLRIRGEGYPAVSVCSDAQLLWVFDPKRFKYDPPGRHTEVRPPLQML